VPSQALREHKLLGTPAPLNLNSELSQLKLKAKMRKVKKDLSRKAQVVGGALGELAAPLLP
jgi:hypothetical protein